MRIASSKILVGLAGAMLSYSMFAHAGEQPVVHVEVAQSFGPRTLEDQTKSAVVRDYLKCWQSMSQGFQENDPAALDSAFTGIAKEKLTNVITQQQKLGITTNYRDHSHNLKFIFYSPEGLSIQLVDDAEYDVEFSDHGKIQSTQRVKARYVAVLSPTEVSWKVRILQADADGEGDATPQK
jgi:hypothetical protein